jgi:MerR family mercuric resistance operon transcriptional regulator
MKIALSIGKLATKTGVGIETIRFYERKGLIPEPPRTAAGYRQYSVDSVQRIAFIRHAKYLGFSLKEIKELLSLRASPRSSCADVRSKAEEKIGEIKRKVAALNNMKSALSKLIKQCNDRTPTSACPILEALDTEMKI